MKAVYEDLNYLFIKDEDGYYRYDSNLNYAHYNGDGGFDVYASTFNEEGTTNKEAVGFFPFNDYNSYYNCIHGGTAGDRNNNFKGYSPHNNNYSDKLGHYDHHFGMTVEASFVMTPDGKYLGKDIEFNFSGDDDLWVFVDGVLVLDIGGVHNPVTGKINFNSGEVIVRDGVHDTDPAQLVVNGSQAGPTTIKEAFSRVTGKEWDDSPYTRHTLKVFYLERGGMYSNLAIDFNLPVYKTITVEKELEGLTEKQLERYNDEYFYYEVKVNGEPYTGPYGVLTRPATDEEKANWVPEYSEETGEYVGGHWTDPDHPNTETINKFGELVKWHIAVENGIVRVKPGWYFTIEELGQNDTFSVAELYGYDSSYVFYDGQENDTQTSDLMEPFFAPTAKYTYKDADDREHEEELPLTEAEYENDEDGRVLWRSGTKNVQYSDWVYFTNTISTKLVVEKVWYDSNGNVVTDTSDSTQYEPITYKIYRIPYQLFDNPDYDPQYVPEDPEDPDHPEKLSPKNRVEYPVQEVRFGDEQSSTSSIGYVSTMEGFTGTLSYDGNDAEKNWKETVSNLPTAGWYLHEGQADRKRVLYEYYISEISNVDGYKHSIKGGLITNDDNEGGSGGETGDDPSNDPQGEQDNESQESHVGEYQYIIKNEPVSPVDKFTQIDIQKEWLDADSIPEDGLDLHKDDFIQFEVIQKRYKAMTAIGEGENKVNTVLYPITINLWDEGGRPASEGGEREVDTVVVYVPKGAKFQILPLYDATDSHNARHVVSVGGIAPDPEIPYSQPTTHTENENAPSFTYYYPGTTFTISNVDSAKEVTLWLYAGHDQWWYLYDNDDPTNYLNKNEANHPLPGYHVWTCQLYCDKDVIWDLEEVYDHIVTNHDAYSLDGEDAPVTTYPKYEMRLFKAEDSEEYTTHIEPLLNAPGNGRGDSEQLWKGSITDLPLYEFANSDDGGTYIYTYEIAEKTIGSEQVDVSPVVGTESTPIEYNGQTSQYLVRWEEQDDGTLKFTNKKKETTEVSAMKDWVDSDGEPMEPPENATVTFTLFADGDTTGKTVVLDGTTVRSEIEAQLAERLEEIENSDMTAEEKEEARTEAEAEAEAALAAWKYGELTTAWKAEWKDLPKYKYVIVDENPDEPSGDPSPEPEEVPVKKPVRIVYTVKETVTYPGYAEVVPDQDEGYVEVDPETFDGVGDVETITNKQLKFDLKIVKVDADNRETALSGARFQLTRKLPGESSFTKFEHDSFEEEGNDHKKTGPFTVDSTEGIILEGLLPGEYQVEEKAAPPGYIITSQPFTFTLAVNGTITSLNADDSLVVPFVKSDDDPAGLQIGNPPGAALPNTGGRGTGLIYLFGILLTGIAGAGLMIRRHRRIS